LIQVATILPQFGTDKWWNVYQKPLLFLLNNPVPRVREYFRDNIVCCDHLDPKVRIAKITGNSVHYQVDKDIRAGNFYSLKSNDNHIRKNFERVIMPLHNWDLRLNKRLIPVFDLGFSSGTWNSTAKDGYIYKGFQATWSAAHDATTGSDKYDAGTSFANAMCGNYDGTNYFVYRSFFYFDTTSMGAGKTVSLANFSLYGVTRIESNVSVQQGTQAATITTADFDNFTGTYFGKTTAWIIASPYYNDMSLNAAGLTYINNSNDVRMCAREYDHDYLNSQPGANYRNGCYYAEKGAGYYPKIYIEYAAAGGESIGFSFNTFKVGGIS
jgi:hypothetical protein